MQRRVHVLGRRTTWTTMSAYSQEYEQRVHIYGCSWERAGALPRSKADTLLPYALVCFRSFRKLAPSWQIDSQRCNGYRQIGRTRVLICDARRVPSAFA